MGEKWSRPSSSSCARSPRCRCSTRRWRGGRGRSLRGSRGTFPTTTRSRPRFTSLTTRNVSDHFSEESLWGAGGRRGEWCDGEKWGELFSFTYPQPEVHDKMQKAHLAKGGAHAFDEAATDYK